MSRIDFYRLNKNGSAEFIDPHMVKLLDIPPRVKLKRLTLRVTLSETKQKDGAMRVAFNTELKVDIDSTDDPLRKAFIDLVLNAARAVYGTAGVLAKGSPVVQVSVIDRDGKQMIPLFDAPTRDESDDD